MVAIVLILSKWFNKYLYCVPDYIKISIWGVIDCQWIIQDDSTGHIFVLHHIE